MVASRSSTRGSALIVALTLVVACFCFFRGAEEQSLVSVQNQGRALQEFTFKTTTKFPEQLDNTDAWIHYGLFVGIVAAVILLSGIIISISMCCGFCCRRCCCAYGKRGSKSCWFILFLVIYISMCILCILGIAFTLTLTTGLSRTRTSVNTFADVGVPSAFQNVRDVVGPLGTELHLLMNRTVDGIIESAFDPVWELVDFANKRLNDTEQVLVRAGNLLDDTNTAFGELRSIFSSLRRYENDGYISGVPDNETVPDVSGTTGGLMADARQSVNDLGAQVVNLTQNVEDAIKGVSADSEAMKSVNDLIDSTTQSVLDAVTDAEKSYNDMDFTSMMNEYYDQYVPLVNKIRIPVLIVLCFLPLLLYGLYIIGALTGRYRLMLVGFWWAASICWLMLLLAMIHVALFIPINDVCRQRDDLIRNGATQFVFNNGSDYASAIGFSSPAEAVVAVNTAIGAFMAKPDLILDCKGEETLLSNLGLDLTSILNLRVRFDDATAGFSNQVDTLNIGNQINETQPIFMSMEDRVLGVSTNLTVFNDTLANYTQDRNTFLSGYDATTIWNATAEAEAQTQLDGVNAKTSTYPVTPRTYTYDDVDELDINDYPLLSPTDRQEVETRQEATVHLVFLNRTVKDIAHQLDRWDLFTGDLEVLLLNATGLLGETKEVITESWARINASRALPQTILNNILGQLDIAIDRAMELARLDGLGKCKFIGDFIRNGWSRGVCRELGGSFGGLGICITLLGFLWFFSWPIILSSKTHFAGKKEDNSDFFEVEMTTRDRKK